MTNYNIPRIGVGVFVLKEGKFLMGQRIGSHGQNTYSLPGGHLEFGESPEECAKRETEEETGLILCLDSIKNGPYTNDFFKEEDKHYVTLFMKAVYQSGIPKIIEPDKCLGWDWYEWNNMPEPLFLPMQNLKKTNFNPYD